MFEGFKKFFSGSEDGSVVLGKEQGNEQGKMMLRVNAFSKLFPETLFDEGNFESIISRARLSEGEIDKVLGWAEEGNLDFSDDSFEGIRDRVVTASIAEEPLI